MAVADTVISEAFTEDIQDMDMPYDGYGGYSMPYGYARYSRYGILEAFILHIHILGDGNYSRYVSLGGFLVCYDYRQGCRILFGNNLKINLN
ncbi:MAG: hypothetical protein ACMUHX_05240 [bacterium]